jgi:hypothetical protein
MFLNTVMIGWGKTADTSFCRFSRGVDTSV